MSGEAGIISTILHAGYRHLREDLVALDQLGGGSKAEDFIGGLPPTRLAALALANIALEAHDQARGQLAPQEPQIAALSGPGLILETQDVADRLRASVGWIPPGMLRAAFKGRTDEGFLTVLEQLQVVFLATLVPFDLAVGGSRYLAFLVEAWHTLRQEELRRLTRSPLGVIVGMLVFHREPRTFDVLRRRYLGRKVRETIGAALRRTPSIADPATREEIDAWTNLAISEEMLRFARMSRREFYTRVLNHDPTFRYLPASIHRNAQNLLDRLGAERRTIPPGGRLESLESPLAGSDESDSLTLGETVRQQEGPGPDQRVHTREIVEAVHRRLGDQAARVIEAFLKPGPTPTIADVAETLGWSGRTVKRVLRQIRTHQQLRGEMLDLLS